MWRGWLNRNYNPPTGRNLRPSAKLMRRMSARERIEMHEYLPPGSRVIGWPKPNSSGRLGGALVFYGPQPEDRTPRVSRVW